MKINTARFLKSGASARHYPDLSLPEIAFAGRSNVGKSSLINTLVNRKKLARTSATPGKTQMLNFFLINDTWVFVDLPGYGYARVPEAVRASWGPMVEAYLMERKLLRLVVLILDIRRDPSEQDLSSWRGSVFTTVPTLSPCRRRTSSPGASAGAGPGRSGPPWNLIPTRRSFHSPPGPGRVRTPCGD